jgi:hypothetical protein
MRSSSHLLVTLAALAVLLTAGGARAAPPQLVATVGPGFSIRLGDADGNRVTLLAPGTYAIRVYDSSVEHNFHLTGPGVDMTTQIETTGVTTWAVTFQAGSYHYQCDPHQTTMFGDFTVGGTPLPPPAPVPSTLLLRGSVGPGATIGLRTAAGRKVVSLAAGPAVVRVADLSTTDNFHLIGPGVNRATSRAGRATVIWRLRLAAGTYRYRSDAHPRLRGSFRVTAA